MTSLTAALLPRQPSGRNDQLPFVGARRRGFFGARCLWVALLPAAMRPAFLCLLFARCASGGDRAMLPCQGRETPCLSLGVILDARKTPTVPIKLLMESDRDKPMRLLLVDDDPRLRDLTGRRLASEGYEVEMAVDGEDGWEKAQARAPDIVVSDIVMPRLDGLGLLDRMRRHPRLRECYIILLTAKDRAEDVSAGFAALANDYVTKPFRMAELVARVHAGSRLKHTQDELRLANQQLREALRQRAELLGVAAHEIRNPLNIITTYLSLLGKDIVSDKTIRDVCLRRAKELAMLIDSLLDAAKIDAGLVVLQPELQNLAPQLHDAKELFAPVAKERDITLALSCPERLMITADRARIAEVLHVLLGNAIALSKAQSTLAIAAFADAEGAVEVRLLFQPAEISADLAALLYEPPGTGGEKIAGMAVGQRLGFSIVRKLVSLMGGECLADSAGEKIHIGFRFKRPLTEAEIRARQRYNTYIDQAPRDRAEGK